MTRPLQFPPNTEGRYRNSDPLMIGCLMKQAVTKRGEDYLTYPQRALFDRIGIRRQVLETDPYGNFLLTGYDYGTRAQLGAARSAVSAGRHVAGTAHPAGRAGRKFVEHARTGVEDADLRRAVLGERRRRVADPEGARTSPTAPAASARSSSRPTIWSSSAWDITRAIAPE